MRGLRKYLLTGFSAALVSEVRCSLLFSFLFRAFLPVFQQLDQTGHSGKMRRVEGKASGGSVVGQKGNETARRKSGRRQGKDAVHLDKFG